MNKYIESLVQLSQYLYLFPCYGIVDGKCECGVEQDSSIGKHPRFGSYVDLATQDEWQIRAWLDTWPNANFAAHCEKSGVFVLDTDPRSGGHKSRHRLDELTDGAIPATVTARTGRYIGRDRVHFGSHEYFMLPEGLKLPSNLNKVKLVGLDIKSNGYVIVPPSRHASGVQYEWEPGKSPQDIPFAEAPESLLDVIVPKRRKSSSSAPWGATHMFTPERLDVSSEIVNPEVDDVWEQVRSESTPATPYGRAAMMGLCDEIYNAGEGERNSTLNKAAFRAGFLVALKHVSYAEASRYLSVAAHRSLSPLPEGEIAGVLAPDRGFKDGYEKAVQQQRQTTTESDDGDRTVRERLNLVNWVDLFTEGEEEDPWLVEGLIARGRGHVLYSDAGLGKSLLTREIAAKLSAGLPLLGLPAGVPIRVLYLDNENTPRGDVLKSLQDMGLTPDQLENLFFASFPDIPSLNTEEGGAALEEVLDEIQPELVIFDTASRFVEGDENSNDTWNALYNFAGKALKARGIAYIRIDHEGKSADKGQRGGSAKKGDVDLVWHMERASNQDPLAFKLSNEKSRIPLSNRSRTLDRMSNPLRHVLRDPLVFDWRNLFDKAQAHWDRIELREATISAFYKWLIAQPRGIHTGRDNSRLNFNAYVGEEGLACAEVGKEDAEQLLKMFRDGKSVAEVLEEEFPYSDPSQWDEAA